MSYNNPQKPNCQNCNKSGLAILPVRYAVVPNYISTSLPVSLGNKVTNTKLSHHKYVLRSLREGFVYIYHEKHPRGSHIDWEVYSVAIDGTLWKQKSTASIVPLSELRCSSKGHNIPASLIAIEKPEKCARVWMAFSEHLWSEQTFKLFGSDSKLRDRRMQTFLPATWITKGGYRHGLEGTRENLEKIIEYQDTFAPSSIVGGLQTPNISQADGTHDEKTLVRQTTRHAFAMRKGQGSDVISAMNAIGELKDGSRNIPIILALWDSVGLVHELNGFRNDAAGWISKYGKERELEITAINSINGVRSALELRASQGATAASEMGIFKWSDENTIKRLEGYDKMHPGDKIGHARQVDLCAYWQRDSDMKVQMSVANSRQFYVGQPDAEWKKSMAEVDARASQLDQLGKGKTKTIRQMRDERTTDWTNAAMAKAWPKYEKKIDLVALEKFKKNHAKFLSSASDLIDARTDDLIAWLESNSLMDALSEYNGNSDSDGIAFEDAVGDMIFGVSSSPNGAIKINTWVGEAKATESNLLWRAIALNQNEGVTAINEILAAAQSNKDVPLSEAALEATRDSTKHFAKLASLCKNGLSLHNAQLKSGITRAPTGGLEKIFMTVGERFFQPFVKKGADVLSEKFVQSLLLVRAGGSYTNVMRVMAAEVTFGKGVRADTLFAFTMARAIAEKRSESFIALKDTWSKLAAESETPKINKDPKFSGSFNESKDLRFGMVATILQGIFAWKLAQDAESQPNNKKIQAELLAARLSFGAGVVDLGATVIKGLSGNDELLSFQSLKLLGGVLSALAAVIAAANDFRSADKNQENGNYRIAILYGFKGLANTGAGACSSLATLSYAKPALEKLFLRFPNSFLARGLSVGVGRLFAWRAILMLGGMGLSIAVIGIQVAIWYFSDDELEVWCEECAFGKNAHLKKKSVKEQMESYEKALKEVMQ